MHREILWEVLKAFGIALILTPILRDVFRSFGIVDRPGLRKVHAHPIPRIGGIPIAIAYAASMVSLSGDGISLTTGALPVGKILPGASLIFLTGLLDDLFALKPLYKLAGQIAAAAVVYWSGLRLETVGQWPVPGWLSFLVTTAWLLLATNAFNLIDGLDGLCAGLGLVATLALSGAALVQGNQPLLGATLPLAGALAGFLCYNFNPANIFLGDSGALLIGFLLGCYGMIWTQKTATLVSLILPVLVLSVPLMDVSLAVMRRFLRSQPILSADRGHIHHRLLEQGLSPRKAALLLYTFATGAAGLAVLSVSPRIGGFQNLVLLAILGIALFGVRQLGYREFDAAGQLLMGGQFQRLLTSKLRLEQLTAGLTAARTEEERWKALVAIARECGWTAVQWTNPQKTREEVLSPADPEWAFSIQAGENNSVQVSGLAGAASGALDLNAFASSVRRSLAPNEAEGAAARVFPKAS
jgi:UDP-GlcNAc:undecaprenyl-phosphate GlcNAc-1-phosphate transferase